MIRIASLFFFSALLALVAAGCGAGDSPAGTKNTTSPKYHTASQEGHWRNQSDEHIPKISVKGDNIVEVTVPLEQTWKPRHYIEVIVLLDEKEREIDSKHFQPTIEKAKAEFRLPNSDGNYRVVVKCNLHDMWIAPVRKD